jgi:uncharacterized protein
MVCQTGHAGHIGVMWKTVSEDCNLACDYCYYSSCGGKPGATIKRISLDLLEKFIQEYMEMTHGFASFIWQGGEPLLAGLDFFQEVVSLQAKYAPRNTIISNSVQTNGTLINEEWAAFFKRYNFLVGISLDGPKEIHDSRRVTSSGKGSFERVMRGVGFLRKAGVPFNILTVIHEGNVDKAKELFSFYEQENFYHVQFIPCMDFRAQETHRTAHYRITAEQYGKFLCEAFDEWYRDGHPIISVREFDNMLTVALGHEAESCIHRATCTKTLILEQNGDAYPCDFYIGNEYKLGNVGMNRLKEILSSPRYDEFMELKPALPEACKSCRHLEYCQGGCPRNRIWKSSKASEVDYFCKGYQMFYDYAKERVLTISNRLRKQFSNSR